MTTPLTAFCVKIVNLFTGGSFYYYTPPKETEWDLDVPDEVANAPRDTFLNALLIELRCAKIPENAFYIDFNTPAKTVHVTFDVKDTVPDDFFSKEAMAEVAEKEKKERQEYAQSCIKDLFKTRFDSIGAAARLRHELAVKGVCDMGLPNAFPIEEGGEEVCEKIRAWLLGHGLGPAGTWDVVLQSGCRFGIRVVIGRNTNPPKPLDEGKDETVAWP